MVFILLQVVYILLHMASIHMHIVFKLLTTFILPQYILSNCCQFPYSPAKLIHYLRCSSTAQHIINKINSNIKNGLNSYHEFKCFLYLSLNFLRFVKDKNYHGSYQDQNQTSERWKSSVNQLVANPKQHVHLKAFK